MPGYLRTGDYPMPGGDALMFVPVQIRVGAGGTERVEYHRAIDLVGERLTAFQRQAADMREPLTTVGETIRDIVKGQFATQGATGLAGKWKPLSPAYAEWKRSKVPGLPILVGVKPTGQRTSRKRARHQTYTRSGQMMLELLDPLSTHVDRRRLLYAPASDIAGWHESGTEHMPARPPVDLRPSDLRVLDRIFVGWVAGLVRKSGL